MRNFQPMRDPKLSQALPELVRDGVITQDLADHIMARYASRDPQSGNRMLLVFAILGSLLVGLGIILIIAHNWDDLSRGVRTAIAFLPVLLGQALVMYTLRKKADVAAWREGSAVLLACGLCASVALISQIYHLSGSLDGYLLTCALLIAPLLYLPRSFVVAFAYLGIITWYGWAARFENGFGSDLLPWPWLGLIAVSIPFYLRQAREHGRTVGFWWLSLCMALAAGVGLQLFYRDWEQPHALALAALAGTFTLAPWLHGKDHAQSWPWVLVGGATLLITMLVFSFRQMWDNDWTLGERDRTDWILIGLYLAISGVAYVRSLSKRKPLERWPYPEGAWLFIGCSFVSLASPALAAILVNLALLALGVITVKQGLERTSMRRMNLGLAILSATILLRFFDTDLSFVLRGLIFIAIGCGFLYMNMRLVRERQRHAS